MVVVEAESEMVAEVVGSSVAVTALICWFPHRHWAAICPCSWHLKQLPVQVSSVHSWGVSFVYWHAASTLIGVWPCGAVVPQARLAAAASVD